MADKVYAYKPEQGRLSGGSFEKQTEYFLNHLHDSFATQLETLTTSLDTLLDRYNTISDRMTALQDSVSGYENRISALENDNTTNKNDIRDLKNSVTTINNTLTSLQTTVNTSSTRLNEIANRVDGIKTEIENYETQFTEMQTSMTTVTESVEEMEAKVEEAYDMFVAGRHASVCFVGESDFEGTTAWYKVAETDAVASGSTLQLNLLAQPVGEQDGPAFTWVVTADANDVTSTGYAEEEVPDGMADNFVVTSWTEEDDGEEITGYTFQIQFQTAGSSGSNGWTEWADVEMDVNDTSWSISVDAGAEVTGLVTGETNVRVRWGEEEDSVDDGLVEGTLSGSLALTMDDGSVVSITACAPDTAGTGITASGSFTPAATEVSYSRRFALWCRNSATSGTGWKFTVDAEATHSYLDSTVWNLYQLEEMESEDGGLVEGVDAIPATETVHATTFAVKNADTIPDGLIALANTDTAPTGFVLCDGTNDTPDLSAYVTDTLHYVQKA